MHDGVAAIGREHACATSDPIDENSIGRTSRRDQPSDTTGGPRATARPGEHDGGATIELADK